MRKNLLFILLIIQLFTHVNAENLSSGISPTPLEIIGVVNKCEQFSDWKQNRHWVELEGIYEEKKLAFTIELDIQEMALFHGEIGSTFEIVNEAPDDVMYNSIFTLNLHGSLYQAKGKSIRLLERKDYEPYIITFLKISPTYVVLSFNNYGIVVIDIQKNPEYMDYFHNDLKLKIKEETAFANFPSGSKLLLESVEDGLIIPAYGLRMDTQWRPRITEAYNRGWYIGDIQLTDGGWLYFNERGVWDWEKKSFDVLPGDELLWIDGEWDNRRYFNLRNFEIIVTYNDYTYDAERNFVIRRTLPIREL